MLRANGKAVQLGVESLYAGGLSGAAVLITAGHLLEAFLCALAASVCVLLLTGAVTISELIKVRVSRTLARYDQPRNVLQCHKCADQRSLTHRILRRL